MFKYFFICIIVILLIQRVKLQSQIYTKDGIRIQFYMNGDKKPINDTLLFQGIEGAIGRYDRLLDKIVFVSKNKQYSDVNLTVKIFEESFNQNENDSTKRITSELLMIKRIKFIDFEKCSNRYVLPLYT